MLLVAAAKRDDALGDAAECAVDAFVAFVASIRCLEKLDEQRRLLEHRQDDVVEQRRCDHFFVFASGEQLLEPQNKTTNKKAILINFQTSFFFVKHT